MKLLTRLAFLLVLSCVFSAPVVGEQKATRDELLDEAIELIDVGRLVSAVIDVKARDAGEFMVSDEARSRFTDEDWAGYHDMLEQRRRHLALYREFLKEELNEREIVTEIIRPLLDGTYSTSELAELVAFLETEAGAKMVGSLPELTTGFMTHSSGIFQRASMAAHKKAEEAGQTDRSRGMRTMADMRSIATAAESWAVDNGEYPGAGSIEELATMLSPNYILRFPLEDGWGNRFGWFVSDNRRHYRLVSVGADGEMEWDSDMIRAEKGTKGKVTTSWKYDIIYQDGAFVQFPEVSRHE